MDTTIVNALGVLAAAILMATLIGQTVKQWRERTTQGVARWFFLGQVTASIGFVAYSLLTGSMLFAVTNGLILLSALGGYVVLRINRRRVAGTRVDFAERMRGEDGYAHVLHHRRAARPVELVFRGMHIAR